MKDAHGNEIKAGQALRRIVDGRGSKAGMEYVVVSEKWNDSDEEESLIAETTYLRELLTEEKAKEFEVA